MKKFREITVQIDNGTGCLVQPIHGDFTYILTAGHVLKDKPEKNIKIVWQKVVNEQIIHENLEIIGEFYFHSNKNKDASILKVKKQENLTTLLRVTDENLFQDKYFLCGHPLIRRNSKNNENDTFRNDELKIVTDKDFGYLEGELVKILAKCDVDGHSGGGILKNYNNLYFIAGIQKGMGMEDGNEDLSKIKFMPLSFFDEIIQENNLEPLDLLTLEQYYIEITKPIFSKQIENNMKILKGSLRDSSKKYIEEIYIDNNDLTNKFLSFLDSKSKLFAVVGNSGSGKTNWLCHTVRQLSDKYTCLFFLGTEIRLNIFEILKNVFSENFTFLNELFNKKRLIIFIDGIDDLDICNTREIIIQFLKDICNKNVKLIISCKSISWQYYLNLNSDPTLIKEEVYKANGNGYILEDLDENHIYEMIFKYNKFYDLDIKFGEKIINWCKKNRFILKLIYETQQTKDSTYIDDFTSSFYEKYYDFVLSKFNENRMTANIILIKICNILFAKNTNFIDLNFNINEPSLINIQEISNEFFNFNILTYDEKNNEIRFYFDKFRDYIIAFKSNGWNKLSDKDFENKIKYFNLDNIILESLELYYSLADNSHKRILDFKVFNFAENYLTLLESMIDKNFKSLTSHFKTDLTKNIGFLGYIDLKENNLLAYSLFETDKTEKIKLLIDDEFKYHREKIQELNKHKNSYSLYGLMNKDITKISYEEEVLHRKIKPNINKIIRLGKLDEKNNKFLHIEFLIGLINQKYLSYFPTFTHNLINVDLDELYRIILFESEKILIKFNEMYLESKQYELIKRSIINSNEKFNDFSKRITNEELNLAELNLFSILGLEEERFAVKKIKDLKLLRVFQIDNRIYLKINFYFNNVRIVSESLNTLVSEIYKIYLEEYETIIKTNFPTLINYFNTYRESPVKYFIGLYNETNQLKTLYQIFSVKDDSLKNNEVIVFDINQLSNMDKWDLKFTFNKVDYNAFEITYSSVENLLEDINNTSFLPWSDSNFNSNYPYTPIRNLVYTKVLSEFNNAFKYIGKQ